MKRESLYHPRKRPAMIRPLLTCTAIVSAFGIPFSTIGLAYGSTATNTGSTASTSSAAAQATVTRINQYPSDDNFYQVIDGTLYHFIGKVGNPVASFPVGAAPTFAKTNAVYVRDANHKFYERRTDGDFLVGTYIPPYEALDLHIPTPIKATDIDQFIAKNSPNSPLIGFGQAFLDAQAKYGVNALYLASHAILESFYGTSMIAVNKHNLFGYQAYDSDPYSNAAYFNSFTDSINWQAYFIGKQYLSTTGDWYGGSPNLDGMNVHYASDPYWAEKIAGIMNRLHPYNPSEYTNAKPLTSTAAAPQGPISDPISQIIKATTPLSATGVTTDSVNFRSEPSTESVPLDVLQPNTKVKVTGVSGNWYRVTVGNTDGWL
jgi:beta-N-acetylglucosaminidase